MRTLSFGMILLVTVTSSLGDMGSIPFRAQAQVLEPNQRALIAYNGKEEILILTTDLQADQETKVLEIMPLPSEPTLTNADVEIFKKATDLINQKLAARHVSGVATLSAGAAGAGAFEVPAGTVTFHDCIGAHDLSVTHVEKPEAFVAWAQGYLKSQGVDTPRIPNALQKVIRDYMQENFMWFVFDVVSLSPTPVTKQAIQFRFSSPFLYYPMRITRTEHGDTTVRLLVLSPGLFEKNECLGIPRDEIRLVHDPVTLTGPEIASLSEDMFVLLGRPKSMQIRNWEITGALSSFHEDVIMGDPMTYGRHIKIRAPSAGHGTKLHQP